MYIWGRIDRWFAAPVGLPSESGSKWQLEILGSGAYPCGEWTNSRAGNGLMTEHMFSWVLGFLTAYNRYGSGTSNVSKSFDVEGIEGLVDKYCSQHPLENLDTASEGLVKELQKLAEP